MGPINQPRQEEDERIFHVANNLVIPAKGCPVICHGLVSASHLNGELGEVRAYHKNRTGFRLEVHFEKTNLKPASVRKENKLQTKIKKAMKDNCSSVEHLEKELSDFLSSQAAEGTPQPIGKDYHWSGYDEFLSCLVMCKKKQTRKVANEMQLVVRVPTAYLGHGDTKENNG